MGTDIKKPLTRNELIDKIIETDNQLNDLEITGIKRDRLIEKKLMLSHRLRLINWVENQNKPYHISCLHENINQRSV